jgi:hypothetical protein
LALVAPLVVPLTVEPLVVCAIAPYDRAKSAPAVAAVINLSFMQGTPFFG